MKSLVDAIKESCNKENKKRKLIKEALHGVKPADEKLFWKWVKDLGEEDIMHVIDKSKKNDYDAFYKKVADLGTTTEQFETFCDIFFTISNEIGDLIEDDEEGYGSDDSNEYATWSAPFSGEKGVKISLKTNGEKMPIILNQYIGEHCGYAMDVDSYKEYLEDNDLEPKGYK